MAKYEIEKLDGLYCVFENGRIIVSFNTLNEAKKAIEKYRNKKNSVYDKAIKMMDSKETIKFVNDREAIEFCNDNKLNKNRIYQKKDEYYYIDVEKVKKLVGAKMKCDVYKYYGDEDVLIQRNYIVDIDGETKNEILKNLKKNIREKFQQNAGPQNEDFVKEKIIIIYK